MHCISVVAFRTWYINMWFCCYDWFLCPGSIPIRQKKLGVLHQSLTPERNLTYQTMAIFFCSRLAHPPFPTLHFGAQTPPFSLLVKPHRWNLLVLLLATHRLAKVRLFGDQMTKVTDLVLDNHPKKHLKQKLGPLCAWKAFEKATWLGIYSWSRGCETHRWRPSVSSKAMRSALSNGAPIEEGGDLTHPTVTRLEDGELRVWVEINYCYFSAPFGSQHQWLRTWPSEIWRANLQGNWRGAADGKLHILHLGESWESVCVWKG